MYMCSILIGVHSMFVLAILPSFYIQHVYLFLYQLILRWNLNVNCVYIVIGILKRILAPSVFCLFLYIVHLCFLKSFYSSSQGKSSPQPFRPPKPEDVATICYTSGTTGTPKVIHPPFWLFFAPSGKFFLLYSSAFQIRDVGYQSYPRELFFLMGTLLQM